MLISLITPCSINGSLKREVASAIDGIGNISVAGVRQVMQAISPERCHVVYPIVVGGRLSIGRQGGPRCCWDSAPDKALQAVVNIGIPMGI